MDKSLRERVRAHTIPLIFAPETDGPSTHHGTGVLVKIGDAYFVLSAGHCIKEVANGTVRTSITSRSSRFELKYVDKVSASVKDFFDYGFLRLTPDVATTCEAFEKTFLSPSRISLANEHVPGGVVLLTGFPMFMRSTDEAGTYMIEFAEFAHPSFGVKPEERPEGFNTSTATIEYLLPRTGFRIQPSNEQPNHPEQLSGMSGCGYWFLDHEDATDFKLFAIHTGHLPESVPFRGDEYVHLRGVKLSCFLKLIYDTYEPLRSSILESWPELPKIWASFPS